MWIDKVSVQDITTVVNVTGVTLSPSTLPLHVGQKGQLTRTITPMNATNQNVTWSSDNAAIATVSSTGLVTAVANGSTIIRTTTQSGGFTAQTTVTVTTPLPSYSTRLTGTTHEKYGLAKSLSVMPGDTVTMEVYAKYLDTNTNNWSAALTNLIGAIANGTAPTGTFIDGGAAGSIGGTTFPFIGVLPRTGDTGTGPKAYLNYMIFDKNYVFKTGGFKRLSATPKENGSDVAHEKLAFEGLDKVIIKEPGYVYIYLSNENDTPVEVYFDDFKVKHSKDIPTPTKLSTTDPTKREWVWGAFIGLKKEYRIIRNIKGTAMVMTRLFNPDHKSPYADVLNVRFGFEFPMRKKVKKAIAN